MASKNIFHVIETDRPYAQVKDAVKRSLMFLGGQMYENADGFQLKQAVNGVSFAFAANFDSYIQMRQTGPTRYEISGLINWSPNTLFWICLIGGIFVIGLAWVVNLLYLFIDPSNAYQQAFFRAQSMIV